jgi:hypothetical protein
MPKITQIPSKISREEQIVALKKYEEENPVGFAKAVEISEYVTKVQNQFDNPKSMYNARRIEGLEVADEKAVWLATTKAVHLTSGRELSCPYTFERKPDGSVDIELPLDAPDWRRGDMKAMKDNYERYSKVASRLQKKLREKGLTPNPVKLMK